MPPPHPKSSPSLGIHDGRSLRGHHPRREPLSELRGPDGRAWSLAWWRTLHGRESRRNGGLAPTPRRHLGSAHALARTTRSLLSPAHGAVNSPPTLQPD